MTAEILLLIIILFFTLSFVFEQLLDYLNYTCFGKPIPNILSDIYSDDKYKTQQKYSLDNYKFNAIHKSLSFFIIIFLFLFNGFAYIDGLTSLITQHFILKPLLFFGIIYFVSDLLNIPFEVYDNFVIEAKYGFNKMTKKTFVLDKIKSYLLVILLGSLILSLIIIIYDKYTTYFWVLAWGLVVVFSIFINVFYSTLIVPLFNKQKPLEEGELRTAIDDFAKKAGFNISNIYVIDSSKRSSKVNAYFSGLGSKKRIVLFDTLIDTLSTDEIVAVLAHEIGHYKHKHIYKSLCAGIIETGLMFYILGLFIGSDVLSQALGLESASFHVGIVAFSYIYIPISIFIQIISNFVSRKSEFQADNFAAKYNLASSLISALKKLSSQNMSNLTPHHFVVFCTYSHPPIFDRISNLLDDKHENR